MPARTYRLIVPIVLIAGCGHAVARVRPGGGPSDSRSAEVAGTLVEVRHYLESGAIGDGHTLCAFLSALGDAPLGVVEDDGTPGMLTIRPNQIPLLVTRTVRVTGTLTGDGQLLVPRAMQVKDGATWTPVEP